MKTAEEILKKNTGHAHGLMDAMVIESMKEYALEACKEALNKASENAMVESDGRIDEFFMFNGYVGDSTIVVSVNNDSILSEDNIPKEVR